MNPRISHQNQSEHLSQYHQTGQTELPKIPPIPSQHEPHDQEYSFQYYQSLKQQQQIHQHHSVSTNDQTVMKQQDPPTPQNMFDETLKSSFLNEQIEKTKDNLKVMMFQPTVPELDDNILERAKANENQLK
jgi:hypothetical protein